VHWANVERVEVIVVLAICLIDHREAIHVLGKVATKRKNVEMNLKKFMGSYFASS